MWTGPPPQRILQRQIAALPFDVLIRRLHSSSLTNPSRSLEAHFLGVNGFAKPDTQERASLLTQTDPAKSVAAADIDTTASELRAVLSHRLLIDVQQQHKQLRLDIDDLSLVLANAVRHRLSPRLVQAALGALKATLGQVASAGQVARQVEALSRVMEAYCDIEDEKDIPVTWNELADILTLAEERWLHFTQTASISFLLLQFLSAIVGAKLPEEQNVAIMLRTDPMLLRKRCLELVNSIVDIMSATRESGEPYGWSLAHVQGMCVAISQLSRFENANPLASHGSTGGIGFWRRKGVGTESVPVWRKVRAALAAQLLAHNTLEKDILVMPLRCTCELFVCVSAVCCGAEVVGRVAAPVHKVLKRAVVGDAKVMNDVIRIGEASLVAEGTSSLLEESIHCITRYSYIFTNGDVWDLVGRACKLLESAPPGMHSAVRQCLCALKASFESARCAPPLDTGFPAFGLAAVTLGTLMMKYGVRVGEVLGEYILQVIEVLPNVRGASNRSSILVRCLSLLSEPHVANNLKMAERHTKAVELLKAEVREMCRHAHATDLTAHECHMLRRSVYRAQPNAVPNKSDGTRDQ
uniref:WGS project CAEQ00000000 data, annotated contig 1891 n=1 Tax=Trypanosoma congolense (strain IL3000) TaxID=1068625 RepID=F9W9T1_TRYCI|nr:unnamed protein product [Trypanosoma congolense IL3000]